MSPGEALLARMMRYEHNARCEISVRLALEPFEY
jgi:hypothetical protein